jgi:hypothetical protein
VVYVKSKDGLPPDPQFERLLKYTLGDGSEEFSVRVKKGQTTRDVKEGLKALHAGINPAAIMWEGSAMDDADAVNEWMSVTGTSPLKVQVVLNEPVQRFKLWLPSGTYDLGEVNMTGKTKEEIWTTLRSRNMILGTINHYRLFAKQDEVQWCDLPGPDVTIVQNEILAMDRGITFKIVDRNRTNRPREVGPLTRMHYQIFTMEGTEVGEPEEIYAPNEITLAQLVTFFILPSGIDLDVGSVSIGIGVQMTRLRGRISR